MAYEKYSWKTGEIITADKLNHIENGIPQVLVLNADVTFDSIEREFTKFDIDISANELFEIWDDVVVVVMWTIEEEDDGETTVSKCTTIATTLIEGPTGEYIMKLPDTDYNVVTVHALTGEDTFSLMDLG